MRHVAIVLTVVLVMAGCMSGGDPQTSPSPTPLPPPPKVVYTAGTVDNCMGTNSQGSPKTGQFKVDPGHDQLIIGFHSSGLGKVGATIKNKDDGSTVFDSQKDINTLPGTTCGGHNHSGNDEVRTVKPGNFTVTITYTGSVAIHFEVTAKSTRNATASPTHSHAASP